MTEQLPFNGIMNLDDNNNVFPAACHKYARNIHFKGNPGNFRAENTPGARLVPFTLPGGHNECIGSYYDPLRLRTFFFNYNSNGRHGIYQFSGDAISAVTVCANVDYLNFTTDTIHSINILYGDETIGDILYFLDCLRRPTKVNIDRARAGGYGVMQRSFIDVAKEPPLLPPTVTYLDDPLATVNNLRRSFFQFRYRFIFDDKEKSVWSPISAMPVPVDYLDSQVDANASKNAIIRLSVGTGNRNVRKVEIAARQSNDAGLYSDFFLLRTVDKAKDGVGDNATYVYDFTNNTAAEYVNLGESNLLFDYVPKGANTQELLNGNIIIYGGITEGYDFDFSLNVAASLDTVPLAIPILT